MAFYVPASARRRRLYATATVAIVVGLVVGLLVGRLLAPSVQDRINSVRSDARQTAAGLRVLALHDTAVAVGAQGDANGGTDIVLQRTRDELTREFSRAPWMSLSAKQSLVSQLDKLDAITDHTSTRFGTAAEALAAAIEATFGA